MLDRPEVPNWLDLARPLAEASMALGRLQQVLQSTSLHQAFLWREMARATVSITQNAGYRVSYDQLVQDLAGLSIDRAEDGSGPAAAKRIFLTASRLFQKAGQADSTSPSSELFHPLWAGAPPEGGLDAPSRAGGGDPNGTEDLTPDQIMALAQDLARTARASSTVPLVSLLLDLFRDHRARRLSPTLARWALPLSIHRAGLLPKVVPTLLGGRLPLLATARSLPPAGLLPPWLARALTALAREADGAARRLQDLTIQHRAWHERLAASGPRRHSRAQGVLGLLAATPVISASLAARHLGCTPQGAALILQQLVDLDVLSVATRRARWKIYLASDLATAGRGGLASDGPLALGRPLPVVDHEAIKQTLDSLLGELERAVAKTNASLTAKNGRTRAGV